MKKNNILWVIFKPFKFLTSFDSIVLSFLSPYEEDSLRKHAHNIINGNEISQSVRAESVNLYKNIVAEIGINVTSNGHNTFRQNMAKNNEASLWWYHPVAFRDSEGDQIFNNIIIILSIQKVAQQYGVDRIILCGAKPCLASVLSLNYEVKEIESVTKRPNIIFYLYGVASRLKYLLNYLRFRRALKKFYKIPLNSKYNLVFSGFWDWSFWKNEKTGKIDDRFFKNLPSTLRAKDINKIGYFAWFDPDSEPDKKGRSLSHVLKPLEGRQDVVILQMLLRLSDVIRALLDFRSLKIYNTAKKTREFQDTFQKNGLYLFPIFEPSLIKGCLNSHIPNCQLIANSVEKAANKYFPRLSLSFLEHFPHSRAFYEGIRRSGKRTLCWAMQHAAYNHEKTFYYLHPEIEFQGIPDKCEVPHPDKIFVMGQFARRLFLECGYEDNQVIISGSTRYDHIRKPKNLINHRLQGNKIILMVCSLDIETELSMVEAVNLAAQNMEGLRLRIRNHPFARVDKQLRYKQLNLHNEISDVSLEEDLANCDLILFSYSTVAEEAFLRGIPVWQWLPQGFNGSALSEIADIPKFGSVSVLQEAIKNFCKNPEQYFPSKKMIEYVADQIFYPADGKAAERIAECCVNELSREKT